MEFAQYIFHIDFVCWKSKKSYTDHFTKRTKYQLITGYDTTYGTVYSSRSHLKKYFQFQNIISAHVSPLCRGKKMRQDDFT